MTLTSLHLHGFRTFARPTDLTLAPRITMEQWGISKPVGMRLV